MRRILRSLFSMQLFSTSLECESSSVYAQSHTPANLILFTVHTSIPLAFNRSSTPATKLSAGLISLWSSTSPRSSPLGSAARSLLVASVRDNPPLALRPRSHPLFPIGAVGDSWATARNSPTLRQSRKCQRRRRLRLSRRIRPSSTSISLRLFARRSRGWAWTGRRVLAW